MNYYSVFYWLTVADGVKSVFNVASNIFTTFSVFLLIFTVVCTIHGLSDECTSKQTNSVWKKYLSRSFALFTILSFITWVGWVLTPTKKDCLLIVAGGAVGNFIVSDTSAKSIPSDITSFLHLSLKNEVEELKDGAKDEIKKDLGVQTPKEKLIDKVKELSKEQLIEYLKSDSTITK